MTTFFLVNLSNITEFMITAGRFQEFTVIITDTSLTQLELEYDFTISSGMNEEGGTVIVCLRLN